MDNKIEETKAVISAIKQEIALLQEYKVSLTSSVVTGAVDVRNIIVPETFEEVSDEIEEGKKENNEPNNPLEEEDN